MIKKIIITFSVIACLCACNETEEKQISESDSLSAVIDSARAHDTLLIKLQQDTLTNDTLTKTKTK